MGKLKSILVTGGAGFIGSNLVDRLSNSELLITILDNFDDYYDPQQKHRNLENALKRDNVNLVIGDIRDKDCVVSIVAENQIDTIIHLAARAGVRPSVSDPLLYESINLNGTINVLEAARTGHIKKLVFGSSSSVYGYDSTPPFKETEACHCQASPYAVTKRAGELYCETYSYLYNLPIVSLRFFTVFGPRQRPEMAIHKFFRAICHDQEIPIYGSGDFCRDFTYIDDIVNGIISAIKIDREGHAIVNLGTTHTITVNDLIAAIEDVIGKKAKRSYQNAQPGDMQITHADISYARQLLNYQPRTELKRGLQLFWEWYQHEFLS